MQLRKEKTVMYKGKDRKTEYLFNELFPFGGNLDEDNRWLRIAEMIPWEELEAEYSKYFSHTGRPALDGRLVIGLMLLKHMSGLSDREVVQELKENPYWQAFCGFDNFVTVKALDASSLTKVRKRLGAKYFRELEKKTYKVLIERKIIKGRGMLVDGTVFPEKIKYPNDVGLLNDVREWLVKNIGKLGKITGEKVRTYKRKARKAYLNFAKRKAKTKKMARKAQKQMIQYVRRNLKQTKELLEKAKPRDIIEWCVIKEIKKRIEVAREIYRQQYEMYKNKTNRIENRIVSFWREYVRPIKRGKAGKVVEFGAKCALSHVGRFLFLDKMSHDNIMESNTETLKTQLKNYEDKFGRKPEYLVADKLYGSRKNREMLDEEGIRASFKQLGRKKKGMPKEDQWFKKKQKERNRIEGSFGNGKEHYGLDKNRYHSRDTSEVWIRTGILAMNLKAAIAKT